MKFVRKNINLFKGDGLVTGIAINASYKGPKDGYAVYVFQREYTDEKVVQEAKVILEETNKAIIRMHRFVMRELSKGGSSKFKRRESTDEETKRMFATQKLVASTLLERYMRETGKDKIEDVDEVNAVLQQIMSWWNEKLTREERIRIETLSRREQEKIFMNAEIDFSGVSGVAEANRAAARNVTKLH
jgi:hypothetical protein